MIGFPLPGSVLCLRGLMYINDQHLQRVRITTTTYVHQALFTVQLHHTDTSETMTAIPPDNAPHNTTTLDFTVRESSNTAKHSREPIPNA